MYYCCICNFLKELFSIVSCETWCKGKDFYFYLPNFFEVFFDLFFRKTSGRISDICLESSNLILFPLRVLNPFPSCRLTHLSRLRVQKYCFITYPPNVFATFFQLFFAFPDCQDVMNALFLSSFGFTFLRSFGLTQKNQKVKATLEKATNSLCSAKIPDNSRFALRQPGFLYAPLAICFTPSPLGRSCSSLAFRSSLLFFFL